MPNRKYFPTLNERFDVKHIQEDFNKYNVPDPDVYRLAVSLNRILITQNVKHFRILAGTQADCGIIGIDSNLPPAQIDKKLTAFLVRHTQRSLAGKFVSLTGETEI
jgi:hypothetical protein